MRKYLPPHFKAIPKQAKLMFKGELFDTYQWPQKMFDGSMATFEMLRRQDTVVVIGIHDDKIVITRQIQPYQDWFYDYPGGRHDNPAEDELTAAKRELREETGMEFKNWKLVNAHQVISKIDWLIYTFVATDLITQGPQHLDAGEKIEVMEVSFAEWEEYADRPDAKFLRSDWMNGIRSIEDFKNLPELYHYE